jgi:Carboxypeptidase regulatory-like domain
VITRPRAKISPEILFFMFLSVLVSQAQTGFPYACRLSGHCFGLIHELQDVVIVRKAEGDVRITSVGRNDPLAGAEVEIFGPGDSSSKYSAKTDSKGWFKIKGLPPGTCRFVVAALGFNSVVGKLTISSHAPRENKLHIKMTVGV